MSPNLRAFAELPDETDSSDGFALLYTREHHRKRSIQDGRLYRHGRDDPRACLRFKFDPDSKSLSAVQPLAGSSREEAARVLKGIGIRCIVAKLFSYIFGRIYQKSVYWLSR
ncbi:unnamed protein product [Zymoseptoria tritici ST99CH_3D7]|uniref:Aconitase A/isopropylmalate dehydratase small subunit swivel domain-containing protein n=1 Tax=Zymoseptoria tritici (strain ST99CH_3D7) TaxID=1276538 RepID=A0A1X7RPV7_ZYMT9|nr:unnamed protein product [Zymoseptoria tritici ST99CH_3D7]